jgi:hypothetical protein
VVQHYNNLVGLLQNIVVVIAHNMVHLVMRITRTTKSTSCRVIVNNDGNHHCCTEHDGNSGEVADKNSTANGAGGVEAKPETVMLNKQRDSYYALSPLLDYMYRPVVCENMSLYEWTSGAEKVRGRFTHTSVDTGQQRDEGAAGDHQMAEEESEQSKANKRGCKAPFLAKHPQARTHHVQIVQPGERKVPNMVGGALPRPDRGNREDYCVAMLTLFKPWRTGVDLKEPLQTWSECFGTHEFTPRQAKIMANFNIKYECNDARDDFAAQCKKKKSKKQLLGFLDNSVLDELDKHRDLEEIDEFFAEEGAFQDFEAALADSSRKAQRRRLQGEEIAGTLQVTGWLTQRQREVDIEAVDDKQNTAAEWKSLLAKKREAILEAQANERKQAPGPPAGKNNYKGDIRVPEELVDNIKIVDKSYLTNRFVCENEDTRKTIDDTVAHSELNEEQERAFRIVANHAASETSEQLLMYLGGMAGTGKSQVIKAIMHFFTVRKETYRFMTMATTGAAAALISGSMYHSILGINDYKPGDSVSSLTKVRTNIDRTTLMLLDEISMVDCEVNYNIGVQLSLAMGITDKPFGGINMIVAGDFAQLPPPGGKAALYSDTVGTTLHRTSSHRVQKATLGKALWHQFTTCVILRQNMRQKRQTVEDNKFRTMLENLRYKAGTHEDIKFLRT